jgi:hypothetical protein
MGVARPEGHNAHDADCNHAVAETDGCASIDALTRSQRYSKLAYCAAKIA